MLKPLVSRTFIVLNTYITGGKRLQMSYLRLHHKKPEKVGHRKQNVSRRKEITQIRSETKSMENRKAGEKQQNQKLFLGEN